MVIDEVLVLRCCRSNFSEPDEELTHEIDEGRGGGLSFGVWDECLREATAADARLGYRIGAAQLPGRLLARQRPHARGARSGWRVD